MSAAGTPSDTATFRPDIEGLRAVAVLLVLAYHARVPGWTGGYIGVDVFFVVSGFLITSMIVRELATTGRIDLVTFYARRARRLLPASLVVIALTVLASAIVLPPLRAMDVAGDGAAAALYVSNIRFVLQATDYLQSELDPSPLLHFWSLGVEEQFYLVWPALLMLAAGRGANVRRIAIAIGVVALASFVLSLAWTASDAPLAFFLLPARAWELALGAGIALGAVRLARIPANVGTAGVAVGLGLILIGALTFDSFTVFPGWAVLLPVVGSGLVIVGGLRRPLGPLSRLLAIRPMQWVGGISYSLYLWHWPLLVLPAAMVGGALPWYARLALVGVAVVLAWASKRWIEDPIRHGRMARLPVRRALEIDRIRECPRGRPVPRDRARRGAAGRRGIHGRGHPAAAEHDAHPADARSIRGGRPRPTTPVPPRNPRPLRPVRRHRPGRSPRTSCRHSRRSARTSPRSTGTAATGRSRPRRRRKDASTAIGARTRRSSCSATPMPPTGSRRWIASPGTRVGSSCP